MKKDTIKLKESENPYRTKGWPPKRRREQAKKLRKRKPWQHSTGPRTPGGKAAVRRNAYTHGFRSGDIAEIRALLRLQRDFMKSVLPRQKAQNMID